MKESYCCYIHTHTSRRQLKLIKTVACRGSRQKCEQKFSVYTFYNVLFFGGRPPEWITSFKIILEPWLGGC